MLGLKQILTGIGQKQSTLARALSLSPAAMSLIVNHGLWPKSLDQSNLQAQIKAWLIGKGAPLSDLKQVFEMVELPPTAPPTPDKQKQSEEDEGMLLRKHHLTQKARQTFGLLRDPFAEPRSQEEVFLTASTRYVRESMRSAARHGGFIAVVGESGAGKSTLRKDLAEWIKKEQQQIIMIEPYVLGLEENDVKGKTLKARHIAESIMAQLNPRASLKLSPEASYRQVHEALKESYRAGNRHLLVIEEAHGLPMPTLKHLKRFHELEDGFAKLLGIVLIGQTELGQKLDERNPKIREVVQRCELVHLRPLDNELENYLHHRFALGGKSLVDVMEADAITALKQKLAGRETYSVLYPLAVHNVLTAALNEAAEIGIPKLNAELILGV